MTKPTDSIPPLKAFLELLPEPHLVLSRDLRCISANHGLAGILGVDPDHVETQLIGRGAGAFWPDVDRVGWQTREFPTEFRAVGGATVNVKVATFAGDVGFLLVRVLASFSENEVTRVFHAQRLETLGMLAGGVAHDFNNILTGILGHLAYLQTILPSTGTHVESLHAIEEGAVRASAMTQQIVSFSRLEPSQPSARVDICEIISKVCALLRGAIPPDIQLQWSRPDRTVRVIASEAHLCQVIINLVVNARDAISSRGIITVDLDTCCEEEEVFDLFGAEPPSPKYGALIVGDNGEGMDEHVKERLFEPYFTTKRDGGTGLGLATVSSIVKSLGGAITVESVMGKGTTFRIVLPIVEDSEAFDSDEDRNTVESDEETVEKGPIRGRGERILVVDDEYAVRNVLGLSLSHLGYEVETAATGLEALEKYADAAGGFDLVILDLLMPGFSGEEVFARLQRIDSGVRVLLVSGFSSQQVVRRILQNGGRDFIQKPFSIEILSEKVRRCLYD